MPRAPLQKFFACLFFFFFGALLRAYQVQQCHYIGPAKSLKDDYSIIHGLEHSPNYDLELRCALWWLPRSYDFLFFSHFTGVGISEFRFFVCLSKQDGIGLDGFWSGCFWERLVCCGTFLSLHMMDFLSFFLDFDSTFRSHKKYGLPIFMVRHPENL